MMKQNTNSPDCVNLSLIGLDCKPRMKGFFYTIMETWKEVKGYEGYYEVSSYGRVKSIDRYVKQHSGRQLKKGKVLRPATDRLGYVNCALSRNNKLSSFRVHRIVALAFVSNPNKLREINHKDCNKQNNHASNLEWCTRKWNIQHAVKNNRIPYYFGEDHPRSKLTDKQRVRLIQQREDGLTLRELSLLYPVSIGHISKICKS